MDEHWITPYLPAEWADDNPWFLCIQLRRNDAVLVIDLGRSGWTTEYEGSLREPAHWFLMSKKNLTSPFVMVVHEGEQPYYTCRVIGNSGSPLKVRVYGIGKKRLDGHADRLWVLPDGSVVTGDDESYFGPLYLKDLSEIIV